MRRKTKQRETILKILQGTASHPTADWIYDQARQRIPNISKGTVYRNLGLLNEAGDILELDFSGRLGRFDGNTQNHYHFRCGKCGRIYDLDEPVVKIMEQRVARKTGFKVTHHHLELGGLCLDCQQLVEMGRV